MFEVVGTKSLDSNAIDFIDKGINFVGRTFENNGIQGKIAKRDFEPNEPFTITATVIGNYKYVKFQKEPYYCSQNINKLSPKILIKKWNDKIAYFFVSNIQKFVSLYDYQQSGYKLDDIKNHIIKLPINLKSEIDFEFMENFIAELEAERIAELEAYLLVTNLKDYKLTTDEQNALKEFENLEWKEFKIGDLFNRLSTKKLPYKAKDLPNIPTDRYILPCLTSSFQNQGLNYYAPKENATVLKNVISIPSNSDIYRAYFQSREFTVLSDAYGIDWIDKNFVLLSQQYLFIVTCINKVTDLPKYSYKNKLGGWNVVKNKFISLPTKNGEIDFKFMENFIIAVQKLVIKYVVLYADEKIEVTKKIVCNKG
ncbi:Type I restriction modification DNA specificity domain [Campylobacter sputorum subsp. bubulus]|uniref:Type I restriction modification DNA specificity domain n=1 Tax=Campylobacter sputorum subsp. sputorum TaxID=32024 RepID=A0A381DLA3_9BACT|nr:restriction endonuclease subunit S [Campylobacter sputorum]ASM34778.1 type IIG restriction/modification system, specificity subunit [Campylobacter sputorum aubsp. sputorum RM3237]QEL04971.1 type IIB restriction/modification system, specificity subunit [Campylobacter sputorum subsp. sputorum]SUX10102.1 Type I restriction modification DNA specificity domain [Campylobacter sputorum subsp. bubulus]SUX11459.1 Type I restriction modification DNA specificity domain [Campylobacter sputorum subsp. sp